MFKKSVLMFVLLLLVPLVSAVPLWTSWGNGGFNSPDSGARYTLFGSNYAQGSINMSNSTLSISSEFPALVEDWNLDGENDVFLFAGSTVAVYNNFLEFKSSVNIGAPIQGQACFQNLDGDADLELAIMSDSSLRIYEASGVDFSLVKTITLDKTYQDVYCDIVATNLVIVHIPSSGEFALVNIDTGLYETYVNKVQNFISCATGFPSDYIRNFQNRAFWSDYDDDNLPEFVQVQSSSDNSIRINAWDFSTGEWDLNNSVAIIADLGNTCEQLDIAMGNIGSKSGTPEIIIRGQFLNNIKLAIVDLTGSIQYSEEVEHTVTEKSYLSFPSVADFDHNSLNELCYVKNANFTCLGSNFVRVFNMRFPQSNITGDYPRFVSMGEFKENTPTQHLEVLTYNGMYERSSSDMVIVMNYTELGHQNITIPMAVSIENQAEFIKDVLLIDPQLSSAFIAAGAQAVCGNSICETSETILTCPLDCTSELRNITARITSIVFEPSIANTWKNNTDVRLTVTVEDTTGANVQARAQLYYGQGVEQDTNYSQLSPTGTSFVFNLKANSTTSSSVLRVTARNDVTPNLEDIQLFGFTVGLDGTVFGDSTSTYSNPFPTAPDPTETDPNDNAIRNAFETLPTGGLGFDMLWYIVMAAVGTAIVWYGFVILKNGSATLAIFIIAEAGLLIMGTLLGFVSAGVIITIVVIGLIIIAMWLRSVFTGTGTS